MGSVDDFAYCFQVQRDLTNGLTILRDYAGGPNEIYVGIAATWQADPSQPIWFIMKNTFDTSNVYDTKVQISPPAQIWNSRASIFP